MGKVLSRVRTYFRGNNSKLSISCSKIEAGSREVTDVEVAAIAKVLGVTVGWLFGNSEERKEQQR